MWRRTYLLLLLVRIYFAISPSYLHPDENFQGPEVIAGMCQCGRTGSQSKAEICGACMLTSRSRPPVFVPKPSNMGVDQLQPGPKRLPSVACLWHPDDTVEMGVGRRWGGYSFAGGDILHSANGDVCSESGA